MARFTIPYYQGVYRMEFINIDGYKVRADFFIKQGAIPSEPTWIYLDPADSPITLRSNPGTDSFSSISQLSGEIRFLSTDTLSIDNFISYGTGDSLYPNWTCTISIFNGNDQVFKASFEVSDEDLEEEWTDNTHVCVIRIKDGLSRLKSIQYSEIANAWNGCEFSETGGNTIFGVIYSILNKLPHLYSGTYCIFDNLMYDDVLFDTAHPTIDQLIVNPKSFLEGIGYSADCFAVLETVLTDYGLELRHDNNRGFVLFRFADYDRLKQGVRYFKATVSPGGIVTIGDSGTATLTDIQLAGWTIGSDPEANDSVVADQYINRYLMAPLSKSEVTVNLRGLDEVFPNENMKRGALVDTVGNTKSYEVSCWTQQEFNLTTGAWVPYVAPDIATRYEVSDGANVPVWEYVELNNPLLGGNLRVALKSPPFALTRNTAFRMRYEWTVVTDPQYICAIFVFTPGGARWVQEDGSLGTAFYAWTIGAADLESRFIGFFGMPGTEAPFYEIDIDVKPLIDDGIVEIFLFADDATIIGNPKVLIKDFGVELDIYSAGKSIKISGIADTKTSGYGGVVEKSYSSTLHDAGYKSTVGQLYHTIGSQEIAKGMFYRDGFSSDATRKRFSEIQALSAMTLGKRYYNRLDVNLSGIIKKATFPSQQSLIGFNPETTMNERLLLYRFVEHPSPDSLRNYIITAINSIDLFSCRANVTLTEVLVNDTGEEIDSNTITYGSAYKLIFENDKDYFRRQEIEQRGKPIRSGGAFAWFFTKLGDVIFGRKTKFIRR